MSDTDQAWERFVCYKLNSLKHIPISRRQAAGKIVYDSFEDGDTETMPIYGIFAIWLGCGKVYEGNFTMERWSDQKKSKHVFALM